MQRKVLIASALITVLASSVVGALAPPANAVSINDVLPDPQSARSPSDNAIASLGVDLSEHEIREDKARYVGSDGTADYWVEIQPDSNVCLFGFIPGENWVAASTCSTSVEFYTTGIGLRLGNKIQAAAVESEAYLVPNEVTPEMLPGTKNLSQEKTSNSLQVRLISTSDFSARKGPIEVKRDSGLDFVFSQLPTIER